jgi:hypothetical protein
MMGIKNRLKGHLQERGDNTTGIQEAITAKKAIKKMKKASMISDGILMAEAKKSFFG